jgi:hypothetical protein
MPYLLSGLLALLVAMIALRWFVAASPARLARAMRWSAAAALIGLGTLLMTRGYGAVGLTLLAVGVWLTSSGPAYWGRPGWGKPAPARRTSRIATDHLDLELDHHSGAISGRVTRGFFAGRDIETLRPVELAHLWADCRFSDPASAQVLEAYLDRLHPTWRDDMARSGASGAGEGTGADTGDPTAGGTMSRATALEILGLGPDASEDDIRRAHRELILKLHPDRGGSHTLATAVNKAKDVLLGRG